MGDPVAAVDWVARAAEVTLPPGLYVDGSFRDAASAQSINSPRNGQSLGELAWADEADADRAVAVARQAFDEGPWPRMHARERGEILMRFGDLVEQHRDELALLISLEMGKPIRACWEIETRALFRTLRYYGQLADKGHGEITPTVDGELSLVTREPSGVVAAVVPWNFPLTLAGWKIAPALAAGCSVVVKPSELSPLSMLRVAELGTEAGLPPGVLNVITGEGHVTGRALGLHPDVDVLTFTGSTDVGRHFLRYAADSNLKRVHLELGGKSPNIIMDDAPDLDAAADTAAWAMFFNTGQMCTAGSRLVVHRSVADRVVDRIVSTAASWRPGDPLDPATTMGPMITAEAAALTMQRIADGVGVDGAQIRCGAERLHLDDQPNPRAGYVAPTVITGLTPDNPLAREELFAPVLSVLVVDDEDEAIRVAGDTPYGLAAAVWTADLGRAHRMSKKLKAGTVWVNCYEEGDLSVPFGGVKLSGAGRDKSPHAIDEYTDLKTTWINHG